MPCSVKPRDGMHILQSVSSVVCSSCKRQLLSSHTAFAFDGPLWPGRAYPSVEDPAAAKPDRAKGGNQHFHLGRDHRMPAKKREIQLTTEVLAHASACIASQSQSSLCGA